MALCTVFIRTAVVLSAAQLDSDNSPASRDFLLCMSRLCCSSRNQSLLEYYTSKKRPVCKKFVVQVDIRRLYCKNCMIYIHRDVMAAHCRPKPSTSPMMTGASSIPNER